jgi:hypothetical protein
VSQAPGLPGTPWCGQCSIAARRHPAALRSTNSKSPSQPIQGSQRLAHLLPVDAFEVVLCRVAQGVERVGS